MRSELHLVEYPGKVALDCSCGCRGAASRYMRCRKKGCVIARCSTGIDIVRVRDEHERTCGATG